MTLPYQETIQNTLRGINIIFKDKFGILINRKTIIFSNNFYEKIALYSSSSGITALLSIYLLKYNVFFK